MASKLPPAPVGDEPVTVPLDVLPEWLAYHGLEILGFDDLGWYARPKQTTIDNEEQVYGREAN